MTLGGLSIVDLAPETLLGLGVVFLLLGRIVPVIFLNRAYAEADRWRKAYETEREARALSDKQTSELLEVAKVNHQLITAIFENSERIRRSGDSDATPTT